MDKTVTLRDKLIMPYTDAVLLEILKNFLRNSYIWFLRKPNIIPTSLSHLLENELEVDGKVYFITTRLLFGMKK